MRVNGPLQYVSSLSSRIANSPRAEWVSEWLWFKATCWRRTTHISSWININVDTTASVQPLYLYQYTDHPAWPRTVSLSRRAIQRCRSSEAQRRRVGLLYITNGLGPWARHWRFLSSFVQQLDVMMNVGLCKGGNKAKRRHHEQRTFKVRKVKGYGSTLHATDYGF